MKATRIGLRPLPAMIGLFWLLIGAWLLLPWRTFDSSPSYESLRQFLPEWVHGVIGAGAGVAVLGPWNRHVRTFGLLVCVVGSSVFGVAFGTANWHGIAIPLWTGITIAGLWAFRQGVSGAYSR